MAPILHDHMSHFEKWYVKYEMLVKIIDGWPVRIWRKHVWLWLVVHRVPADGLVPLVASSAGTAVTKITHYDGLIDCSIPIANNNYRQISNIGCTLGNTIVEHSDAVGSLPVAAAPTTSSFLAWHQASVYWAKITARQDDKHLNIGIWCDLY